MDSDFALSLLEITRSTLSPASKAIYKKYKTSIPKQGSDERVKFAEDLLGLVRWYSSHLLGALARAVGLRDDEPYSKIVKYVCSCLQPGFFEKLFHRAKEFVRIEKKPIFDFEIPKVAGVKDYEEIIISYFIVNTFADKEKDEIVRILKEMDIDEEAAKDVAEKILYQAGGTTLFSTICVTLGKKKMKELVLSVIYKILEKAIGKEVAEEILKRLVKEVPQKVFQQIANVISAALWVVTVNDLLLAPANRVLIPFVVSVALMRKIEELSIA
jgi:hypothetical protein